MLDGGSDGTVGRWFYGSMARTPRITEPPYHPPACQPLLENTQMGLKSGNKFILVVSTVAPRGQGPSRRDTWGQAGKSPLEPLDKGVEGLAASTPSLALEFPEKEESPGRGKAFGAVGMLRTGAPAPLGTLTGVHRTMGS